MLGAGLAACAAPGAAPRQPPASIAAEPDLGVSNPYGNYLAGRHAQQERDYAAAADFYTRALNQDPGNSELLGRTFLLDLSQGKVADASMLALRVKRADASSGMVELVRIVDAAGAGDFATAEKLSASLSPNGADRFIGPMLSAWARAGMGHYPGALAALQPFDQIPGIAPLKDLHVALIADLAGQTDTADRAYASVLKANPHLSWRLVDLVGNFFERTGRNEDARRLYEHFAAQEQDGDLVAPALARLASGQKAAPPPRVADQMTAPRVASAADGMAEALFDLASVLDHGDTQDLALIYARLVLHLHPGHVLAQILVGDVLANEHRPEEALAIDRAIDPASPFRWAARLRAVANLQTLGRNDEAIAELKAMSAERPEKEQPYFLLGDLLRGEDHFAEAATAYDQAVARLGASDPQQWAIFYSRGIALERSNQWPRAEADLLKALELQPDQPLVLNYLGYSWVDKGVHLDKALNMIRRAVELKPNDGYIVDSLGWAYFRLGKYVQATQNLEQAAELRPEDPTINDHLGDAYWRTGRVLEARYQWRRALQFGPDADEIKTIEGKLSQGLGTAAEQDKPAASARGG